MDKLIVLASSSPYRRELLKKLGLPFICDSPEIDETAQAQECIEQLVDRLAIEKANAVAHKYPNALIIGSDQAAVLDGKILGKPDTHQVAFEQLQQVSGKKLVFYTSVALLNTRSNNVYHEVVPFSVYFRHLDDEEIEAYLRKEQPYNCVGAFKSEGLGISLFERLEGEDPNTLIGLPLIRLINMLRAEGVSFY